MNPYNNNFGPFGFPMVGLPFPPFPVRRRTRVPLLDQRGIYEVCTTGMVENTDAAAPSVDYGIDPCIWRALPCECVIVWKVRHTVSTAGADLPANVVVPTGGRTTVSDTLSGSASGSKIPVIDNKSTQVAGGDITVPAGSGSDAQRSYTTEHWVYIDKASGTFRLMGVTAAAAPVPSNTPAAGA